MEHIECSGGNLEHIESSGGNLEQAVAESAVFFVFLSKD